MPFSITGDDGDYKVVTTKTGKVHGTHKSKASAERQLRAIYANWKGNESVELNESNTLITTISQRTGLPEAQLEQFWELAVQKNSGKSDNNDTMFWSKVMEDFQNLVNQVDVEEAKNIMETREKYRQAAGVFLDSLVKDNYVDAESSFKEMANSRLNNNIESKAEKYCQEVLSKEAQKLARDA